VSKRVSPAQRLQKEIDEVFAGGEDLAGAIEKIAVLGARLLLQTAIEAEVTAFLVRGTTERFASQLFGNCVTKTNTLESLVIAGFVRGLSVRDVEATLAEPVLAAWGIDTDANPVFVGLDAASSCW